jgi:hypothetical protein
MTYSVHDQRALYTAIVARISTQTGKQVGRSKAPADPATPYCVVYPFPDLGTEGPLNNPTENAMGQFQVTCVGADMDEAQALQTDVRTALLGWIPSVVGMDTFPIDLAQGSGVIQDPEHKTLFMTTDRFRVDTSA